MTGRITGALRILVLLSGLCLISCSSTPVSTQRSDLPDVIIEGMVIRNELLFPVTDVMISVPATGGFAGCGNIMPRSECRTSFEAVNYTADKLVVSWKEYGEPKQTGGFVIEIPKDLVRGRPAWLEVVIFAMGQAGARLVQF